MPEKTSRVTKESSSQPSRAPAMPEARVSAANAIPSPMTRWCGWIRDRVGVGDASVLMAAPTLVPFDQLAEVRLAVVLAVEFADPAGQRGEELVRQAGHVVEHGQEVALVDH